MTGKMPEEGINPAEFPELLYDLWQCFVDLHGARRRGMNGAEPISFEEINAYSAVRGLKFEHWEVAAIKALDAVAMGSDPAVGGGQ